jgi:hypothetical protein
MNKNVSINNFVMTIENAISDEVCDTIISKLKNSKNYFSTNAYIKSPVVQNDVNRQDMQTHGSVFLHHVQSEEGKEYNTVFLDCLKGAYKAYTETYKAGIGPSSIDADVSFNTFKFQETPIGGGFHSWHFENGARLANDRILVWSLFLNDVEEGGELEFIYYPMRIKPKKGTLVLFPAHFTHTHRGNPPISNTKYIGTGWYIQEYL